MGFLSGLFGGGDSGGGGGQAAPTLLQLSQQFPEIAQNYFSATQQIAPQEAALQLQLLQDYGVPMMQAQQDAFSSVFPNTAGLTEQLSALASEGMDGELPDDIKEQFLEQMRAQLGQQAGGRMGAADIGRGLLGLQEQRRGQYQNLGLAMSGKQPVYNANVPQFTSFQSGATPGMQSNYALQSYAMQPQGATGSGLGSMLGGLDFGSMFGGMGGGGGASAVPSYNTSSFGTVNPNTGMSSAVGFLPF